MANALIGFDNGADTATLSYGSWTAGLPLNNLKHRVQAKVARSVDLLLTSTRLKIDVGPDRIVRALALANHNISVEGRYRARGYSDGAYTNLVDDHDWADVFPTVYDSSDLEWEMPNFWSGKYLPSELEGSRWPLIHLLETFSTSRYWLIEIDDTTNAAGFVQAGRLFIGPAWQFEVNYTRPSSSLALETGTDVQVARSGTEYFDPQPTFRVAQFSTDWMTLDEAMASAFEIQRRMGLHGEVLFVQNPDDTRHALRRQFLGRLRQLSPIENPYPDIHATAWQIKEQL